MASALEEKGGGGGGGEETLTIQSFFPIKDCLHLGLDIRS